MITFLFVAVGLVLMFYSATQHPQDSRLFLVGFLIGLVGLTLLLFKVYQLLLVNLHLNTP